MKITENARPKYKLQYLNPPHLYHSILIAQSKHTHYSYICIISYLSICTTFRQVQISEVPNAMLFCYSSETSIVASQSLPVITPSHATADAFHWHRAVPVECICRELRGERLTCGVHVPGSCSELHPPLLPWGLPPQPALSGMDVMCRLCGGCLF